MEIIQRTITSMFLAIALTALCPMLAVGDDGSEKSCADIDKIAIAEPARARFILDTLYTMDCLGGQEDDWDLAVNVKEAMQKVPDETNVANVLKTVVGELSKINKTLEEEQMFSRDSRDNKKVLADGLREAINNFNTNPIAKTGAHKPEYWKFHLNDGKVDVGIDINTELAACKDIIRADECLSSYARAKQLVSYATVTKRTLDYVSMRQIRELGVYVAMLNKRWGHYFNDARSQFFWELGFNGWRYKKNNEDKEGLLSPPNYQWIILHPSIGLEYVDTNAGDRFREAIVIEGLGINRWTWKDSKMKLPLGVSVIGVYGDRSSVPQFGYGALFHYNNNLSLGVTRRGRETGVILSLDLAKLFLKQDADKEYEFKYRLP